MTSKAVLLKHDPLTYHIQNIDIAQIANDAKYKWGNSSMQLNLLFPKLADQDQRDRSSLCLDLCKDAQSLQTGRVELLDKIAICAVAKKLQQKRRRTSPRDQGCLGRLPFSIRCDRTRRSCQGKR